MSAAVSKAAVTTGTRAAFKKEELIQNHVKTTSNLNLKLAKKNL